MMHTRPFILGLEPRIHESVWLDTKSLFDLVGGNTGNLAFHYAIQRHLNILSPSLPWDTPSLMMEEAGDIAIIPCANQLGAHCELGELAGQFRSIKQPIVAIGLGAQSNLNFEIPQIPLGTLEWVRVISDHSASDVPNIAVRGSFTLEVLDHYGLGDKAVVVGCPTLFINPDPNLGKKIARRLTEPKRIAVTAGHPSWAQLSKIEASLARMVTATNGSYIGQSPLEMIQLTRGEGHKLNKELIELCRDYILPEMNSEEFVKWCGQHGNVFFDTETWLEHYRRFDFVIGTRFHGVMVALQAGIPALCIVHDSRTLEMCQEMKVPYVCADDVCDGINRNQLLKLFNFDPDAFDKNRLKSGRYYINFLTSNNLEVSHKLVNSFISAL